MSITVYIEDYLTRFKGLESEIAICPILLRTVCSRSEVCLLIYVETTGEHSAREGGEDRVCLCSMVIRLERRYGSPTVKYVTICAM